jgi:hypothetical protein
VIPTARDTLSILFIPLCAILSIPHHARATDRHWSRASGVWTVPAKVTSSFGRTLIDPITDIVKDAPQM